MTQSMTSDLNAVLPVDSEVGHIRLGGSFRLPPVKAESKEGADAGDIRLGGSFRLPPVKSEPTEVADAGSIRLGGSFRLLAA